MPLIIIATLSEITKDDAEIFSEAEGCVISVPDEFLCVAVDEAQDSFQRFMTAKEGQTVKSLLKLKKKAHYWYLTIHLTFTKYICTQGTSVRYLVGY